MLRVVQTLNGAVHAPVPPNKALPQHFLGARRNKGGVAVAKCIIEGTA